MTERGNSKVKSEGIVGKQKKENQKNFTLCTQGINIDSFVLLYLGKIHIYMAHNEVCTF